MSTDDSIKCKFKLPETEVSIFDAWDTYKEVDQYLMRDDWKDPVVERGFRLLKVIRSALTVWKAAAHHSGEAAFNYDGYDSIRPKDSPAPSMDAHAGLSLEVCKKFIRRLRSEICIPGPRTPRHAIIEADTRYTERHRIADELEALIAELGKQP